MIDTFDELFMNEAYLYASKSKDLSTQVGAVIVRDKISIMRGYNGPLRGVDDTNPKIYEKPYKHFAMEHAERNAIYNCARNGISCDNCLIYVTWAPCAECARAIIQSGIKKVIVHKDAPIHDSITIKESQQMAFDFFKEANIDVEFWSGVIIIPTLKFNGKTLNWKNGWR